MFPVLGGVFQDVEDRFLCRFELDTLAGDILEDVEHGADVVLRIDRARADVVRRPDGGHLAHDLPASASFLVNSSMSFLSSIILSSRPTVSFWNLSSSVSRSSSLLRCLAISASACFCAVTSR